MFKDIGTTEMLPPTYVYDCGHRLSLCCSATYDIQLLAGLVQCDGHWAPMNTHWPKKICLDIVGSKSVGRACTGTGAHKIREHLRLVITVCHVIHILLAR